MNDLIIIIQKIINNIKSIDAAITLQAKLFYENPANDNNTFEEDEKEIKQLTQNYTDLSILTSKLQNIITDNRTLTIQYNELYDKLVEFNKSDRKEIVNDGIRILSEALDIINDILNPPK